MSSGCLTDIQWTWVSWRVQCTEPFRLSTSEKKRVFNWSCCCCCCCCFSSPLEEEEVEDCWDFELRAAIEELRIPSVAKDTKLGEKRKRYVTDQWASGWKFKRRETLSIVLVSHIGVGALDWRGPPLRIIYDKIQKHAWFCYLYLVFSYPDGASSCFYHVAESLLLQYLNTQINTHTYHHSNCSYLHNKW